MQFNIVGHDDQRNLTLFVDGEMYVADNNHPNWDRIMKGLALDDESITELFDLTTAVAQKFERLSERVTVGGGTVYFDGTAIDNALTKQLGRFLDESVEDWQPLVNFFEKVMQNPNEHSREQLYAWLDRHQFTIASDGDLIAYKGVRADFTSIHAGPAIVNGESVNGHVPNPVGAVVEFDRSQVVVDPGMGCARGLHVGTWAYASSFGGGPTLKVKVNPRDVVSVPTDCDAQKVRVCRYTVLEQVAAPEGTAVSTWATPYPEDSDEFVDDFCESCDGEFFTEELDEDGLCEECAWDATDGDDPQACSRGFVGCNCGL